MSVSHLPPKQKLLPQPRALRNWLREQRHPRTPRENRCQGSSQASIPAPRRQGGLSGDWRMAPPPSPRGICVSRRRFPLPPPPHCEGEIQLWAHAVLPTRLSHPHTHSAATRGGRRLTLWHCALGAPEELRLHVKYPEDHIRRARTTAPSRPRRTPTTALRKKADSHHPLPGHVSPGRARAPAGTEKAPMSPSPGARTGSLQTEPITLPSEQLPGCFLPVGVGQLPACACPPARAAL